MTDTNTEAQEQQQRASERRTGGLTLPTNPAQELQRLMEDEGRSRSSTSGSTPPSNEETFLPSNEGRKEDTKQGRGEHTSARAQEGVREGRGARRKEGASGGRSAPFFTDVLARAKEGKKAGKEILTRLNVDIPDKLHKDVKVHCLQHDITLRELVPALLEAYLAVQQQEAGE